MKRNKSLIWGGFIFYLIIIALISMLLIVPGVEKLKEAKDIKELTQEEKNTLTSEVDTNYDNLKQNLEEKYNELENEIKSKYALKNTEINEKINDLSAQQNKEFFANQFSKKYYELQSEIDALRKEKSDLFFKESEEKRNNKKLKSEEINKLDEKRLIEIENINNQNSDKNIIKNKGIAKIISGLVIILLPLLYVMLVFNKLTRLSNLVNEKWSQVDVLLKQRSDLIPNLVQTIKGYTSHEKGTLMKVTKARNQVIKASTKEEEILANKNLSNVINKLFILQEDYPELKADSNFMDLQQNLREIEDNIALYRQEYNRFVLKYINKLETFPSNIIASLFGFKKELFFEIEENEKETPIIEF